MSKPHGAFKLRLKQLISRREDIYLHTEGCMTKRGQLMGNLTETMSTTFTGVNSELKLQMQIANVCYIDTYRFKLKSKNKQTQRQKQSCV